MIAYNNPTNGAAEWEGRCCDDPDADICSGGYRCDNFFVYCLRPYNTPATTDGCGESVHSVISSRESNGGHIDFSGSIALGLPNPLSLAAVGPWLVSYLLVYSCYFYSSALFNCYCAYRAYSCILKWLTMTLQTMMIWSKLSL